MKGQAAPIYWILFLTLIFGIIMLVTLLSPTIETISSLAKNLTTGLTQSGNVTQTVDRWNMSFLTVPLILIVGLALAIIIVGYTMKREFETREGYYG